jgi:hypothetical protein
VICADLEPDPMFTIYFGGLQQALAQTTIAIVNIFTIS